jgi:hypothetical protein
MIDREQRDAIHQRVAQFAPDAPWAEVIHAPEELLASNGATEPLDQLRDQPVAAFCGIGNPAGFRHTLDTCGCDVVAMKEYPDHHRYDRDDIESLAQWAQQTGASEIICTAKDLVKIGVESLGGLPLHALTIGMQFLKGQSQFEAQLADWRKRLRTTLQSTDAVPRLEAGDSRLEFITPSRLVWRDDSDANHKLGEKVSMARTRDMNIQPIRFQRSTMTPFGRHLLALTAVLTLCSTSRGAHELSSQGLALWLSADQGVETLDGRVVAWRDRTSARHVARVPTGFTVPPSMPNRPLSVSRPARS